MKEGLSRFVWLLPVASCVLSWALTYAVVVHGRQGRLLDVPNERSSHSAPTPRGGGIGMVVAFCGALIILMAAGAIEQRSALAIAFSGMLVSAIGLIDDAMGVRAVVRFAVHLAAAAIVVFNVATIPEVSLAAYGLHGRLLLISCSILFVVWTTNLFNFMDGIDGIAASEAAAVCIAGAVLNWYHDGSVGLTLALSSLSAASLGFLRWNWPKASVFMGDVGSGFLGFSIASLALAICKGGALPIESWGILGGVFFVDATTTLLRRALTGQRWLQAHRSHAYQHLARRWKAHIKVTGSVIVVNILWLTPWAALAAAKPEHAKYFLIIALAPLLIAAFLFDSGRPESQQ